MLLDLSSELLRIETRQRDYTLSAGENFDTATGVDKV